MTNKTLDEDLMVTGKSLLENYKHVGMDTFF
jgi:hypothetical protein